MSQPAVSMLISSLEKELGQQLFFRTQGQRGSIRLTQAGEIFRDYAYKYLDDYMNMRIALVQGRPYPPVVISTSPSPGSTLMPLLVQAFKSSFPQISCMVQAYSGNEVLNRLLQRQCDLTVTGIPLQESDPDMISEEFFYDPMELICPSSMEIPDVITLNRLQKLPLVVRNLNCNTTQLLIDGLGKAGMALSDMNIAVQVFSNYDVLQAVAYGSGVGFVTRSLMTTHPDYRQKVRSVSVKRLKIRRHLSLVRLRNTELSSSAQLFWTYALENHWRKNLFPYDTMPQ